MSDPEQPEVLRIVKAMVDEGTAYVVMGNHEWVPIALRIRPASGRMRKSSQEAAWTSYRRA